MRDLILTVGPTCWLGTIDGLGVRVENIDMIIWLVSYNYIIFSQQLAMGFEIENYPNVVTAALVCNPQSIGLFQSALTLALDNNCDALISPIFPDVYLQNCE